MGVEYDLVDTKYGRVFELGKMVTSWNGFHVAA